MRIDLLLSVLVALMDAALGAVILLRIDERYLKDDERPLPWHITTFALWLLMIVLHLNAVAYPNHNPWVTVMVMMGSDLLLMAPLTIWYFGRRRGDAAGQVLGAGLSFFPIMIATVGLIAVVFGQGAFA